MRRFFLPLLLSVLVVVFFSGRVYSLDPPHDWAASSIDCSSCHMPHSAPGGAITAVAGNANLCQSCHTVGGQATGKPFAELDQAFPWPGLPAGKLPSGNSHRWDSGASGHVKTVAGNSSPGKVQSGGVFTGRYAKSYTITISTGGNVGVARFDWSAVRWAGDTGGGSGTNILTGANVALDQGVTVTFTDGASSPSFLVGNQWNVYVRTDINQPTITALTRRISEGKIMCSTCHDQHSQALEPFDPAAPAYGGSGTGAGRHFQRINNNTNQMCLDCHSARNKGSLSGQTDNLTHPVNVSIPGSGNYKSPTTLPLDKTTSRVQCMSCHKPHYTATSDGTLTRLSNINSLCTDCHTNSDTTNGSHLKSATGVLWPGGQYGTLFPQITDATRRGFCTNCHRGHGWPDAGAPTQDYAKLAVDNEENLCFTCHDTNGPAARNAQILFVDPKVIRHPVNDSEQVTSSMVRAVECTGCHNPHKAQSGAHDYNTTATSTRNQVSNPIKGVPGVSVNYTGLGNFVAPGAGNYTAVSEATLEYQICFKCHSSYSFGTNPPAGLSPVYNTGTATFTNGSSTVTGSGTAWVTDHVGAWIRRGSESTAYKITARASGTSITISPAYSGVTASGQAYNISLQSDLAQEFNPANASFHPVVAGLSSAGSGSSALQAAQLAAPWATNRGTQTMMCSDCHNTDAASPAAQGPHGSAVAFMLRGPKTLWPPTVLVDNEGNRQDIYNTSFCSNCHTWTNNNKSHSEHMKAGRAAYCYSCHLLVPHGGKLGRLIGDGDGAMPARYAYQNNRSNMWITGFTKGSQPNNYAQQNCGATCAPDKHPLTNGAQW